MCMKKVKNSTKLVHKKEALPISSSYLAIPPLLLSFLGLAFYWPSLRYNFQFDDLANITKFFSIRHKQFSDLFFQGPRWISYWINSIHYKIGKFDPFSYRLFNVISHSITSVLIFFLFYVALSGLKKKSFFSMHALTIAFATAMIFLLHPVQTQTVSYVIQGQLEGLAGFFIVINCFCFLLLARSKNGAQRVFLTLLLLVLAALSCGTKEIAIMSPFLLVVFDWFFVAQGNLQDLKKRFLIHGAYFTLVFGIYLYFLKPTFLLTFLG